MRVSAFHDYLNSSTFCSMAHATRRLAGEVAPELVALGIAPVDYTVLGQVALTPGIAPAELARECALSPQHVAGVLARAEQAGTVRRVGRRGRGRATEVHITPAGIELLKQGWPVVRGAGSERLTATQQRLIQSLVARLRHAPEDPEDLVVLIDEHGEAVGTADRVSVHSEDTPRHKAFSTYLFDDQGRVLVTRRALHKATWPGVWTNAACGHLRPGEDPQQAARRRVPQELGVEPTGLVTVLPHFSYRAVDASGIVENEFCPVMLGRIEADRLRVDPEEVAESRWVGWQELHRTAREMPMLLSPWSVEQILALGEDPWQLAPGRQEADHDR